MTQSRDFKFKIKVADMKIIENQSSFEKTIGEGQKEVEIVEKNKTEEKGERILENETREEKNVGVGGMFVLLQGQNLLAQLSAIFAWAAFIFYCVYRIRRRNQERYA